MLDIDYIMDLLQWDRSSEEQERGIELAKRIRYINVFLQPGFPAGKSTWDNCAKVLSMKTNAELEPYMIELMEWIQDMNWPGAFCINAEKLGILSTNQCGGSLDESERLYGGACREHRLRRTGFGRRAADGALYGKRRDLL